MTQKLLRGVLLLVFMGLVPVACCHEERDYANIRDVQLFLSELGPNKTLLTEGASTAAPELTAAVRLTYDYLATAPSGLLFGNAALGLSCEGPGKRGLKDQVASITLTSTGLFNGVAAGQSLAQYVQCSGGSSQFQGVRFPLGQLADSLNSWKAGSDGYLDMPLDLFIGPLPRDNANQQFQLRIQLKSGAEVVQTTPAIIWQ